MNDIVDIKNGNIIIKDKNNKMGIININGETVLKPVYDDIKFSFSDTYIIKQNDKYGIAKKNDEIVLNPTYKTMNYINTADIIEAAKME